MAHDPLFSTRADDPRFHPLLVAYRASLEGARETFVHALEGGQHDSVERQAHDLKGSGSSYGYPSLTEAARQLELAASQPQAREDLHENLQNTITVLDRILSGLASLAGPPPDSA